MKELSNLIIRIGFVLIVFGLVSCHFDSPIFTPDPNDKAYHCHRQDGSVDPNAVWCYPVDHTHTCCLENYTCGTLEGEPNCEYRGNPDNGSNGGSDLLSAKRKTLPRIADAP